MRNNIHRSQEGRMKFLSDLKDVITEQPYLTVKELSLLFCCSESKILEGKRIVLSERNSSANEALTKLENRVRYDVLELLAINPTLTNKELRLRLGIDEVVIENCRLHITEEEMAAERIRLQLTGTNIQFVKDFKPTVKVFVDSTGKIWNDVSEFAGVVEYGGECYKNEHFNYRCEMDMIASR